MTVSMRRLDPIADEDLVREAVLWLDEQPQFFKDADAAWGTEDADSYLEIMKREPQADFGVLDDGELIAVVTVTLEGKQVFNSHLMVRRGANPSVIATAVATLIGQLVGQGLMREAWSWLARKNLGARRILEAVGMRRDGLTMFKGQSHGRPIEWVRYSVRVN